MKFKSRLKSAAVKARVAAFSAMLAVSPLVHSCDATYGGVTMVEKQKTFAEEYRSSKDKRAFLKKFVLANSFATCKSFLESVFSDRSLSLDEKQLAASFVYRRYKRKMLDYSLKEIKHPVFLKEDGELSNVEKHKLIILSELLSLDKKYLDEYADYVSEKCPSTTILISGGKQHIPAIAPHFANALEFRKYITSDAEAFSLARHYMKSGSLYVSMFAAAAMLNIDPIKGAKEIKREADSTLNPLKEELLRGVLRGFGKMMPTRIPYAGGQQGR